MPDELRNPQLRITFDMAEDYELLRRIADWFPGDVLVPLRQVMAWLLEHPEVARINVHVRHRSSEGLDRGSGSHDLQL